MRRNCLFIATIISLFALSSCQPQNEKPIEEDIQTKKIMIENLEDGKPVEVEVEYVDGKYILGGDMIVEPYTESAVGVRKHWRWPNGVIPYQLNITGTLADRFRVAVRTINERTKLCLRERTDEEDYVVVNPSTSICRSTLGRGTWIKDEILLQPGCSTGSIMHELLHTAGLLHEQQRWDRDDWITINWSNVRNTFTAQANFRRLPIFTKDINYYDYSSIMHYPARTSDMSIVIDPSQPLITPKQSGVVIGQRDSLSLGDIAGLNAMYYDASDYNCGPEAPLDSSIFVSQNVPTKVQVYELFDVSLTFKNSGPTTWIPGYKLKSNSTGWLVTEVPIGQTVAPDEEVTVNFSLRAMTVGVFGFQWSMSRPFTGRFGEASARVNIEVESLDGSASCAELDEQLVGAKTRLKQWQDLLLVVSPSGKGDVVAEIRRVNAEIAAIEKQKDNLGCP